MFFGDLKSLTRHCHKLSDDSRGYTNAVQPFLARNNNIVLKCLRYLGFVHSFIHFEAGDCVDATNKNAQCVFLRIWSTEIDPQRLSLPHRKEDASLLDNVVG